MNDDYATKVTKEIQQGWDYLQNRQRERPRFQVMLDTLVVQAAAAGAIRDAFTGVVAGILSLATLYTGELTVTPFVTEENDGTNKRHEFKISRGGTWVGTVGYIGPSGTMKNGDHARQVGALLSAGVTMVIAPFPEFLISGKAPIL